MNGNRWFRGNTHTHTTRSDGNATPEAVAKWYQNHGYNFLVITDHNVFVDPSTVQLPDGMGKDFILIPGEEITDGRMIHTTAMNIRREAAWTCDDNDLSKIIQFQVDETLRAGGIPILNHPNDRFTVSAEDMLPVKNLALFELYNGRPIIKNYGDDQHPSTEAIWDNLLTQGMAIFGVAADDAHHHTEMSRKHAIPGRGWIMVRAMTLTPDSITQSMAKGDFYASTGVFLKRCDRSTTTYIVEVDALKTGQEIESSLSLSARRVETGAEGFRIEFIGPHGEILETINGERGRFEIRNSLPYVRAKATFTRKPPDEDGYEEYYAWGQPFLCGTSGQQT